MKTVIIEDEAIIAEQLQWMLAEIAPSIEIVVILSSLKNARKWFMANPEPDLMFMDIQLSDGISFDLFNYFQIRTPIIFTTAYDEYAVRAFKVNGIDYLIKPYDEQDLMQALSKYKQLKSPATLPHELLNSLLNWNNENKLYKEKFIVYHRNNAIPLDVKEIALVELDNVIYLIKADGVKYASDYQSLEELEMLLNPQYFYRANRQQIIQIHYIESYKGDSTGKVFVKMKMAAMPEIEISRLKAPNFKRWLDR